MSREIKFRAWDDGVMIYADKYQDDRNYSEYDYLRFFFENIRSDAKVMQYPGLKDRNGKDIYQGDILQFSRIKASGFHCAGGLYERNEIESFTGVVEFDEGTFRITKTNAYPFDSILGCWGKTFSKEHGWLLYKLHVHEDRIGGYNNAVYGNPEVIGNIYEHPDLLK